MSIVKAENLTKVYGKDNAQVVALDHVSFEVPKGQFLAIVGPSGSGKSTLLHLLGGVDRPTSGRVLIDGEDIYALNESSLAVFRRRQIGLIYQFYNLLPVLNVEENITLPYSWTGKSRIRHSCSKWRPRLAFPTGYGICRISFPAASNSVFPSGAR